MNELKVNNKDTGMALTETVIVFSLLKPFKKLTPSFY